MNEKKDATKSVDEQFKNRVDEIAKDTFKQIEKLVSEHIDVRTSMGKPPDTLETLQAYDDFMFMFLERLIYLRGINKTASMRFLSKFHSSKK